MSDFRPPIHNPLVVAFTSLVMHPLSLWWGEYEKVELEGDGMERLRQLRDKRVILCPNHSHAHDGIVLYGLKTMLDIDFRCVAAREIFDWWHGFLGWYLQRIGVYSVERDIIDRRSIKVTVATITDSRYKFVTFPEGKISNRNDIVLPVEEGLVSLFLAAASALDKKAPGEPLYAVPIGLKYRYIQDISNKLSNALLRLEQRLDVDDHSGTLKERFFRVRDRIFGRICSEFNLDRCELATIRNDLIKSVKDPSRADRLKALCTYHPTEEMSQEILASGVDMLERELYHRVSQKGKRAVFMSVGEPIDVTTYLPEYERSRRAACKHLSDDIEMQLRGLVGVAEPERKIAA